MAEPTQSVPVSPPPMTTTSLSRAWIGLRVGLAGQHGLGVGGEILHREMHAREVAALDGQVARLGGAGADHRGVVFLEEDLRLDVVADVGVADELDALLLQELDAAQQRPPACRASCSGCRT